MRNLLKRKRGVYWVLGKNGWGNTSLGSILRVECQKLDKRVCQIAFREFFNSWREAFIEQNTTALHAMKESLECFDVIVFDDVDMTLRRKSCTTECLNNFFHSVVRNKRTKILLLCDREFL